MPTELFPSARPNKHGFSATVGQENLSLLSQRQRTTYNRNSNYEHFIAPPITRHRRNRTVGDGRSPTQAILSLFPPPPLTEPGNSIIERHIKFQVSAQDPSMLARLGFSTGSSSPVSATQPMLQHSHTRQHSSPADMISSSSSDRSSPVTQESSPATSTPSSRTSSLTHRGPSAKQGSDIGDFIVEVDNWVIDIERKLRALEERHRRIFSEDLKPDSMVVHIPPEHQLSV